MPGCISFRDAPLEHIQHYYATQLLFLGYARLRLVDAYEKKSESSNNSATSKDVDSVREEIGNMLDQVIKDGAEEGSDEHYYAT
jgi:hypothetical protein